MTIRLNPSDLATTRSDLGLVIGTDVLSPNGSAANLTNLPTDLSGDLRNIALGSAADRITLLNGIVDPLTDETDVDTSSSANETFTSGSGGFYSGVSTGDMFDVAGATITTSPSFTNQANSYDNDDGTTSYHAGGPSNDYYQIDLGSGVTRSAISYTVGMWNAGISSGYGTVFDYKLQGSNDGASFTDIDSRSSITHNGAIASSKIKYSFSKSTAYRYWRFVIVTSNGSYTGVGEIEIEFSVPQDVTLISTPYTATSAPSKTILGFQTVENEAITINTDLKGFVSRDGGSNFTEVTLVLKTTLGQTGTKYYECAETTLTSTSGSSMVWKITTHNSTDIEIHGVALSWS